MPFQLELTVDCLLALSLLRLFLSGYIMSTGLAD
jgi:hypothetical protein